MSLGTLLLQPQIFERMQGRSAAQELGDEVMALLHRLALDGAAVEALLPALQQAGDALGLRLAQRVRDKLPQGLAAIAGLFAPLLASLTSLGSRTAAASRTELLGRIAGALDTLAGATDSLSDDAIRSFVRRVAAIARNDFGLDTAVLVAEMRQFLADFRAALATAPAAAGSGSAATRQALACLLLRIERELLPQMPALAFDADLIAGLLVAELRRTGLDQVRDKAGCLLGRIGAVLRALADATRLLANQGTPQSRSAPAASRPREAAARATRAPRTTRAAAAAAPPRSEDGQYCWYASWLYAKRRQGFFVGNSFGTALAQTIVPGYPEDEVWLSSDRKTLVLRRAGGDDEVLHRSDTPFEWNEAPQFSGATPVAGAPGAPKEHFIVRRIGPTFLEEWTHITSALADFAAGFWHFMEMGISPKEVGANLPLWLWNFGRGISAAVTTPLPSLIARQAGWGVSGKYPFSPLVAMLSVVLGSLEGLHTKTNAKNSFLQWLTLLGGDAISAFTIHAVTQGVHNIFLSVFTLINYEGAGQKPEHGPDPRPNNWDMAGPVIGFINTLIGILVFKLVRREDHGLPIGGNATPFLLWYFIGAPVGAFVGAFSGTLIGWAIGRTVTPAQLWKEPVKAAAMGLLLFPVQLYLAKEGDTDDGRYNPNIDPQGNAFATPRQPFAGYPEAANAPYRLPLAAGTATYVGQANQGFFSHMRYGGTVQVYAYDFAHDFQDEILAVRDGTVVDWFDFYPDDVELDLSGASAADTATGLAAAAAGQAAGLISTGQSGFNGALTGNWNFVLIRHDTVDPAHDRDQGGLTVVTFAEYGHGANGGVRAAFALRGIAPGAIIGTQVQQGHVIMLAGDTGTSFHNHLHLHVRGATAATAVPATPPPVPYPPIRPGSLTPYTLPFVFREAKHVIGRDGPLRHLTWYVSENTRLG